MTPYSKDFPVSWEELHRNARALSWRLLEQGPWKGIIAITRGGLVPAAILCREMDIRLIDTICIVSYGADEKGDAAMKQGELNVLKGVEGDGEGFILVDDLVDTGRSEEHTSELQSPDPLVCRLLLEKKKKT